MRPQRKFLALLLAICLIVPCLSALAAGLANPGRYIGTWEGGEDYGGTREYYLEILDCEDDVFTVALDIYRIRSFDSMTALLTPDAPSAVLSTGVFDEFSVLGTLDFGEDRVDLLILESDCPDLPAGTAIAFERGASA